MDRERRDLENILLAEGLGPERAAEYAYRMQRLGIGTGELRRRLKSGESPHEIAQMNPLMDWVPLGLALIGGGTLGYLVYRSQVAAQTLATQNAQLQAQVAQDQVQLGTALAANTPSTTPNANTGGTGA